MGARGPKLGPPALRPWRLYDPFANGIPPLAGRHFSSHRCPHVSGWRRIHKPVSKSTSHNFTASVSSATIHSSMASTKQQKTTIGHGLPIVTGKTLDAIHHVYAGKKWGKHLTAVRDRLVQENPQLVRFIESQIGKYPRNLHTAMFEVVIGTLTVLEHQTLVENGGVKEQ
jgi:hypothetical protein